MLVVGDLHVKSSEPHLKAIRELFNFIEKKYNNEIIVQLGDFFDTSAIHHGIVEEFIDRTKKVGKHWYILTGNHDKSYIKGNILLPLKHYDHLTVIEEKTELLIENSSCLFLPYVHNAKEVYKDIKWSGDFCFAHITNEEDAFGEEGVNTDKIDAFQIFGHTHTYKKYKDEKIVLGVSLPTRNGEIANRLLHIKSKIDVQMIDHNINFTYEDINYGKFPENKNNILNVKNAPSIVSVHEMYKEYYIRDEGIEVKLSDDNAEETSFTFEKGDIKETFGLYGKETSLDKSIIDCGIEYMTECKL